MLEISCFILHEVIYSLFSIVLKICSDFRSYSSTMFNDCKYTDCVVHILFFEWLQTIRYTTFCSFIKVDFIQLEFVDRLAFVELHLHYTGRTCLILIHSDHFEYSTLF